MHDPVICIRMELLKLCCLTVSPPFLNDHGWNTRPKTAVIQDRLCFHKLTIIAQSCLMTL